MTVDAIQGDQTVAPHIGEFKLNSASMGFQALTSSLSSTGTSVGKATYAPVKIQMHLNGLLSPKLSTYLAMATRVPTVEIRLYNSTKMYYKTVFENVFFTNVSTESADDGVQNIEFAYGRVRWFAPTDLAGLTAPVQVGCWDVMLYAKC
jgi:Hemolysin-coregulated protein (uncharacterized)